ncbi:MAG: glycosyltransferase [Bdellovibrionales bacterium]|nr:glycosyltransferase [Bdellovibrionales bacterium]
MRISIVTPSFNSARFLRETIESVLNQAGDFHLEYHVQDGGSKDETIAILKEYDERAKRGEFDRLRRSTTFTWASEKDGGMYDAISRGMRRMSGEVAAWLNSDDVYLPGTLLIVSEVFSKLAEIRWLKGVTDYIDSSSRMLGSGKCHLYDRQWIREGVFGIEGPFIQQDSVFWRRELWEAVGGIDPSYRLAGDYELWIRFAAQARLYSVNRRFSQFRQVEGQLSGSIETYRKEMARAFPGGRRGRPGLKVLYSLSSRLPRLANFLYGLTERSSGLVQVDKAKGYAVVEARAVVYEVES